MEHDPHRRAARHRAEPPLPEAEGVRDQRAEVDRSRLAHVAVAAADPEQDDEAARDGEPEGEQAIEPRGRERAALAHAPRSGATNSRSERFGHCRWSRRTTSTARSV